MGSALSCEHGEKGPEKISDFKDITDRRSEDLAVGPREPGVHPPNHPLRTAVYAPFLQDVLHTAPLKTRDWGVVLAFALAPVGAVELAKLGRRAIRPSP